MAAYLLLLGCAPSRIVTRNQLMFPEVLNEYGIEVRQHFSYIEPSGTTYDGSPHRISTEQRFVVTNHNDEIRCVVLRFEGISRRRGGRGAIENTFAKISPHQTLYYGGLLYDSASKVEIDVFEQDSSSFNKKCNSNRSLNWFDKMPSY